MLARDLRQDPELVKRLSAALNRLKSLGSQRHAPQGLWGCLDVLQGCGCVPLWSLLPTPDPTPQAKLMAPRKAQQTRSVSRGAQGAPGSYASWQTVPAGRADPSCVCRGAGEWLECSVRSFFLASAGGGEAQAHFRIVGTELSTGLYGWMSDLAVH